MVQAKSSREVRRQIESLSHAYYAESSQRRILANEVKESRKRTLEEEEHTVNKRLKKQDDKRSWDLKGLLQQRGYSGGEIEALITVLPCRDAIYLPLQNP